MKYRKMNERIPWEVSALGFGCMRLPSKKFLFIKRVKIDEAIETIRYGIDKGINYLDTAYGYMMGKSEIVVGKALKDGYREKVKLVTKLPMWKIKSEGDYEKYFQKQLDKLDVDNLDIYLFHALNKKRFETVKKLKLIEKMEKAKADGKIKHIGFSFHDSFEIFKEIVDYYNWDICLVQHNYYDQGHQAGYEGIQYAHSKGISVAIMEPLRGGTLAKPDKEALEIMNDAENKRTPVDWALQYLWDKPEISVVLSGMGSKKMVDENCASADNSGSGSLTDNDKIILDRLAMNYKKKIVVPCTSCGYCLEEEGCPEHVDIPRNFEILNNFSKDANREKYTNQYKKMVKDCHDASNCVQCGKCLDKCPQSIDIPNELKKVVLVFEDGKEIGDL